MVFERATNKDENRSVAGSDERELIERSVTDPAAVASLYRRHHAAISKYISRRVAVSTRHEAAVTVEHKTARTRAQCKQAINASKH